ncbi:histidine phosphatase family protein [Arenibaculum pallidiluteum]|uniref:histidine phosphatase family protein n=1 Tax=Arenibaculum pallidiluteum TaxID=2812559 RepID=UPI001A965221|nr:histidine phosphatase family protein [Arenibaculum pallidiluteum]
MTRPGSVPLLETEFWFLRHGETTANRDGIVAGTIDAPLTGAGLRQAEAAALRLTGAGIAAIWSSPQLRARESARIVAERLALPVVLVPGLGERNWGEWEGQPRAVLVRGRRPAGGEGPEEFRDRVLAALAAIAPPWPALVVGHSGTFRVLHAALGFGEAGETIGNARPVRMSRGGLLIDED